MKALISGYYGFGNTGDELILRTMIRELRLRKPDLKITVLSAAPEKTARDCGVAAVGRWNPFILFRALLSCDVLISGGGGLFQDRTGSLSLYYYLALIAVAGMLGKKNVLYSAGVNDLRKMNGKLAGALINTVDVITVRDQASACLLASWGVAAEKINITADPVLLYGVLKRHAAGRAPVFAFILRPPEKQVDRAAAAVAAVAGRVRDELGAKILLLPFQKRFDLPFADVVAALTGKEAQVIEWESPEEAARRIEDVDLVISQRFHGLVLAVLAGIPPVGISIDPKVQRFMREIGRDCFSGFEEPEVLAAYIRESWRQRESIGRDMEELRQRMQKRARSAADLAVRAFSV